MMTCGDFPDPEFWPTHRDWHFHWALSVSIDSFLNLKIKSPVLLIYIEWKQFFNYFSHSYSYHNCCKYAHIKKQKSLQQILIAMNNLAKKINIKIFLKRKKNHFLHCITKVWHMKSIKHWKVEAHLAIYFLHGKIIGTNSVQRLLCENVLCIYFLSLLTS